jgi:hypothetical protein
MATSMFFVDKKTHIVDDGSSQGSGLVFFVSNREQVRPIKTAVRRPFFRVSGG